MKRLKLHFVHICLLTLSLFLYGCNNNSVSPPSNSTEHTPMWPMFGYNGRHSCNPYGIKATMQPVNSGTVNWIDTIGTYYQFYDANELSVDALGNIYFISNKTDSIHIIKFRPDGSINWEKPGFYSDHFYGFAFSSDEKRVYYHNEYGLTCIDSSGNTIWTFSGYSNGCLPAVAKDGTIYLCLNSALNSISPDGNLKWSTININIPYSDPVIDRDENIYIFYSTGNYIYELIKFNNNGNILWRKTCSSNCVPLYVSTIVIDGYNYIYFKADSLYSLDKNGKSRWSKNNNGSLYVPAITSDNKIIADSTNYLISLDTTGKTLWKTLIPNLNFGFSHSIALDDYDNAYFISENVSSPSHAFSVDKSGNLRWDVQLPVAWPGYPGPVISPIGNLFTTPKRPYIVVSIK